MLLLDLQAQQQAASMVQQVRDAHGLRLAARRIALQHESPGSHDDAVCRQLQNESEVNVHMCMDLAKLTAPVQCRSWHIMVVGFLLYRMSHRHRG